MLQETERAAWFQYASNFTDRGFDVGNRAEGHGAQNVIDGFRFDGEARTVSSHEIHRDTPAVDARRRQTTGHIGRIDGQHLGDRFGKMGNIESRSEPDFENRSVKTSASFPSEFGEIIGREQAIDHPGQQSVFVDSHFHILLVEGGSSVSEDES